MKVNMDSWESFVIFMGIMVILAYPPATSYTPVLIAFVLLMIYNEIRTIRNIAQFWATKVQDAEDADED